MPWLRWVLPGLMALALPGCSGAGTTSEGELTVLAAASLTEAFEELGEAFEDDTGATVRLSFAGSQQLATQVVEGAPADVFASADTAQMDVVVDAGAAASGPVVFAGNRLAIAVEPGNPRGITGLADLADPEVVLVLAAPQVPAGRYARELLDAARVAAEADSLETDVRAALSKVALGEADAAVVYASDLVAAREAVDRVPIPDDHGVTATYPIAPLAASPSPELARDFIDLVRSAAGQAILAGHGFVPAP